MLLLAGACDSRARKHESVGEKTPLPQADAGARREPPKIRLRSQGIDGLSFQNANRRVELEKREETWRIVAPKPEAAADASVVERLFEDLEGVEMVQPEAAEPGELSVHIVARRRGSVVFDAWLGATTSTRGQLFRLTNAKDVWYVRRIPPWIYFATDNDFRRRSAK